MSDGDARVADAIGDTGPFLHLHEIDRLDALQVFTRIEVPGLVWRELENFGLSRAVLRPGEVTPPLAVAEVPEGLHRGSEEGGSLRLQPADEQVLALARHTRYRLPVLTDDLAVRRRIEHEGGIAVGTVGVLVRCHCIGGSSFSQLEDSIERLMTRSSLHMSRPFRRFVRKLIRG